MISYHNFFILHFTEALAENQSRLQPRAGPQIYPDKVNLKVTVYLVHLYNREFERREVLGGGSRGLGKLEPPPPPQKKKKKKLEAG